MPYEKSKFPKVIREQLSGSIIVQDCFKSEKNWIFWGGFERVTAVPLLRLVGSSNKN